MVSALRFVKLRIIGARRTCSTVSLRLPRLPRVASKIPSSNRTDGFADSIENSPARKANETMSFRGVVEKSPALETARYVSAPAKCPRWLTAEKSRAVETARYVSAPAKCPRWLTAEKSPAVETRTIVPVMRRDDGVPPYSPVEAHRPSVAVTNVPLPGDSHGHFVPSE